MSRHLTLLVLISLSRPAAGTGLEETPSALQEETSVGAVVAGTVRFADGEALSGVEVILRLDEACCRSSYVQKTATEDDGSYRFEDVPVGVYRVRVPGPERESVDKIIEVTEASGTTGIDFSRPREGSTPRAIAARLVMNEVSEDVEVPDYVPGMVGVLDDGTFQFRLTPGDHRQRVSFPPGYYLDSVTSGSETLFSMQAIGRRMRVVTFQLTVPAPPAAVPEIVITLGFSR